MVSFIKFSLLAVITLSILAPSAFGQKSRAILPASDNEILEVLPWQPLFNRSQLSAVRERLSADPKNVELAATVARGYIKAGSTAGDPRFFGYARSAIGPWWESELPPPEIASVRAKLKEKNHNYEGAIRDVESMLNQRSLDSQGWIELSNLNRVIGRYSNAQNACDELAKFAEEVQQNVCSIPLLAVNGNATLANSRIDALILYAEKDSQELLPWALTMKAEISRIRGDDESANQFFAKATLNESNNYAKRTYAEFLINRDQPQKAFDLLKENVSDTGVLLLAAIAAKQSGNETEAKHWQEELRQRFEEIRLRGGTPHGRFEAQYLLALEGNSERSLTVALENWGKQKEARDARNVLEAAIATKDVKAADTVIRFLKENKTEDIELLELVKRLEQL